MYESLGLNPFLQPTTAPVSNVEYISGYQFISENERGAVSNSYIRNIDADKINAGTIVVAVNLGTTGTSAFLKFDGANNRIVVNDGTVDRIWIGNLTP